MLIYEYKLDGNKQQYAAIDEAIHIVQFIRNKCLRLWMDGERISKNDLQTYCAVLMLAGGYFCNGLPTIARCMISRFSPYHPISPAKNAPLVKPLSKSH